MKNRFMYLFLFLIAGTIYSQNIPSFKNRSYADANSFYDKNSIPNFTFSEDGRVSGIKNGNPKNGTHR